MVYYTDFHVYNSFINLALFCNIFLKIDKTNNYEILFRINNLFRICLSAKEILRRKQI